MQLFRAVEERAQHLQITLHEDEKVATSERVLQVAELINSKSQHPQTSGAGLENQSQFTSESQLSDIIWIQIGTVAGGSRREKDQGHRVGGWMFSFSSGKNDELFHFSSFCFLILFLICVLSTAHSSSFPFPLYPSISLPPQSMGCLFSSLFPPISQSSPPPLPLLSGYFALSFICG